MRFFAYLGLLAVVVLLACSCAAPDDQALRLAERLATADSAALFERRALFEYRVVAETEKADSQTFGLRDLVLANRAYRFETTGDGPHEVLIPLRIDADEIDGLAFSIASRGFSRVAVSWAAPNERSERSGDAAGRSFELQEQRRPKRYEVDLASHPEWRGDVGSLLLRFEKSARFDSSSSFLKIRPVELLEAEAIETRLASALTRPWHLELSSDVRRSLVNLPGRQFEFPLTLTEDATELRFSFALEESVMAAQTFRIEISSAERGREVVFEDRLDPRSGQSGRWFDASADLTRYRGQRIKLFFSNESEARPDPARGFAVWANPEILDQVEAHPRPNVVLISLDTLRADRLSSYGYFRSTTPNLDRWAAGSAVTFRNAIASAPWTLPSHASMMTGMDAVRHGVNHHGSIPLATTLLAEVLAEDGYSTMAITGGGYLRPQFGYTQGFDQFVYWPERLAKNEMDGGLRRVRQWLVENSSRRFFLFFHTYEPHYPFHRREPFFSTYQKSEGVEGRVRGEIQMRARGRAAGEVRWDHDYFVVKDRDGQVHEGLNEAELDLLQRLYDSGVAYTDSKISAVLDLLRSLELDESTIVIVTSDHGEALGEDGRAGHAFLEDYNSKIPLFIALPGGSGAGSVIERQVSSTDIVPTLVDVLGLELDQPLDGRSLLPLINGDDLDGEAVAWTYASSMNFGLGLRLDNRWKYVFNNTPFLALKDERLHDLESNPAETIDQIAAGTSPLEVEQLRRRVESMYRQQHNGLRVEISNQEPDGALSGTFLVVGGNPAFVKAVDHGCSCVHWRKGRVYFELGPGQQIELFFEAGRQTHVVVEGAFTQDGGGVSSSFNQRLDGTAGDALAFEGGIWKSRQGVESSDTTGLRVWIEGRLDTATREVETDTELLDQLRALGYLN